MTVCLPDRNLIIYKVTNLVNGKVYIGKTIKTLKDRKAKHIADAKRGSNILFHRAMRKNGISNFFFEVFSHCLSKEEMKQKEIETIKIMHSKNPDGYNLTDGGEGTIGFNITNETREKHRKAMIGNKINLGREPTTETRIKLSLAKKGRPPNSVGSPKTSKWYAAMNVMRGKSFRFGYKPSDKTKEKLRAANVGRKHTDEARDKIKAAWVIRKQKMASRMAA
jgi:group I intron endonuclease